MTDRGIFRRLLQNLASHRLHMTLIDPDFAAPEENARIAHAAARAGTDAIMVGGSTDQTQGKVDACVKAIKERTDLPVILFPTTAAALTPRADAIYFMSLLNSTDLKFVMREQVRGAPVVRMMKLEPIPMGYIVVEPGMAVGKVGKADCIPRDVPERAASFALAGEYLGMKLIYLEAGSGAPEQVPPGMIAAVKETITVPLVVGGGIRTPEAARIAAGAGADIIVTGTIAEKAENVEIVLKGIVEAMR